VSALNVVWSETSLDPDGRSHYALCTLVNNTLDRAELGFIHRNGFQQLPEKFSGTGNGAGAVVIIHGGHQAGEAPKIIESVRRLGWAISIVVGDEEGIFPTELLLGPRHKVWVQMPVIGKHDHADRRLICGYPHDAPAYLALCEDEKRERRLNWFYAGQVNHDSRRACVAQLQMMRDGFLYRSPGFWNGLPRDEYYRLLASCKIAPCPAGAATPDTLRVAEALEAGCVPIVEDRWPPFFPRGGRAKTGYWEYVFGEKPPFPILTDWRDFPTLYDQALHEWPTNRDRLQSWWSSYKIKMCSWLVEDVNAVR
jgi:hypothetical protein